MINYLPAQVFLF